jgi:hypothetical protein
MVLKKDKSKKLKKDKLKKPRAKKRLTGLVVLDGRRQIDRRTGMNRDIPPMGGAGGSPNLMAALAARPPISAQASYAIQTPDQFKQAQDISNIAEAVKKTIKIGEATTLGDVEELKKVPVKTYPRGSAGTQYYGSAEQIGQRNNLIAKLQAEQQAKISGGMAKSAGGAAQSEPPAPMVQQPASMTEAPAPKPRGRPRKATGQAAMVQSPDVLQPPEWYGGGNAAETAPLAPINFADPYTSSLVGRDPV